MTKFNIRYSNGEQGKIFDSNVAAHNYLIFSGYYKKTSPEGGYAKRNFPDAQIIGI